MEAVPDDPLLELEELVRVLDVPLEVPELERDELLVPLLVPLLLDVPLLEVTAIGVQQQIEPSEQ